MNIYDHTKQAENKVQDAIAIVSLARSTVNNSTPTADEIERCKQQLAQIEAANRHLQSAADYLKLAGKD